MNDTIIKSKNDYRDYKVITLKNELNVLLVYDKNASQASAALTVDCGSFDEEKILGMAHFLEHMLFLGSEKYPNEGDYHNFIAKNGGSSNAYTAGDHTCYYFDIQTSEFENGLDMFGHFFISPLMNKNSVKKEMNAVNSEHKKNITSDSWRTLQLIKTFSNPKNPFSRFTTGNSDTLNVKNMEKKVVEFYENNYSSNIMKLVVCSSHSISDLEKMVTKIFSNVKNNKIMTNRKYDILFKTNKIISYIPTKDINKIMICWPVMLDNAKEILKSKSFTLLADIVGHEGPRSLIDNLKKNNLITYGSIGLMETFDNQIIVSIEFILTMNGKNNVNVIYNLVYYFFDLLKKAFEDFDLIKKIYDEIRYINTQSFNYLEIDGMSDYVTKISSDWVKKKLKSHELLNNDFNYPEFTKKILDSTKYILNLLTDKKSLIIISDKKLKLKKYDTEPYYGSKYVNESDMTMFNVYDDVIFENIKKDIRLPRKNPFVCYDPTLLKLKNMDKPEKLYDKNGLSIYYKYQSESKIPHTYSYISIKIPNLYKNSQTFLATNMFISCMKNLLNPYVYECGQADYLLDDYIENDLLYLEIYGCQEKLFQILKLYFDTLMDAQIDVENFNKIKEATKLHLENRKFATPYQQIYGVIEKHKYNTYYDTNELLEVIDSINVFDVNKVRNIIFDQVNITAYFHGNINETHAREYGLLLKKYINQHINIVPEKKVKAMTDKKIILKSDNELEKNSVVAFCFNVGYVQEKNIKNYIKKIILLQALDQCIEKEFFNDLRTRQQLGYIVSAHVKSIGDIRNPYYMYVFLVQSDHKNTNYIIKAIDKFIKESKKIVDNLKKTEFDSIKNAIYESYNKKDTTLESESRRLF